MAEAVQYAAEKIDEFENTIDIFVVNEDGAACDSYVFLEMRFENRSLAVFSVARNFCRKQTVRSEISQTA